MRKLLTSILIGCFVGIALATVVNKVRDDQGFVAGVQEIQEQEIQSVDDSSVRSNPGIPLRLSIPSLSIDTVVESVALDEQDRMDVPKDADNVGWYSPGFRPGQKGNSVMAGHFDKEDGSPAVFYKLSSLKKGDTINVEDENGTSVTFVVYDVQTFEYDKVPLEVIFGNSETENLNLITCEGSFNSSQKNYSHRTVVYSKIQT